MAHSDCVDNAPRWADSATAAQYIGVTRKTIYNMCADGRLTSYFLGPRILRIDLNEIDRVLGRRE
jgi:excisionase family DNA binding protein